MDCSPILRDVENPAFDLLITGCKHIGIAIEGNLPFLGGGIYKMTEIHYIKYCSFLAFWARKVFWVCPTVPLSSKLTSLYYEGILSMRTFAIWNKSRAVCLLLLAILAVRLPDSTTQIWQSLRHRCPWTYMKLLEGQDRQLEPLTHQLVRSWHSIHREIQCKSHLAWTQHLGASPRPHTLVFHSAQW